jgi:hypothetical protein
MNDNPLLPYGCPKCSRHFAAKPHAIDHWWVKHHGSQLNELVAHWKANRPSLKTRALEPMIAMLNESGTVMAAGWRPIDTIESTLESCILWNGVYRFVGWRGEDGWHNEANQDRDDYPEEPQPTHWHPWPDDPSRVV